MPEFLSRFLKPIADFWKGLDKSQKIRLYITSAVVVVAVGLGLYLLTKPTYTTIIDNASSADIGEMQKVLTEKGIPYKLSDDKTGIIVNIKNSDAAHLELSTAGYPKNGMNFADALGSIKLTTTESDKKHIWQELDEAKIVRQLKLLKNVKDASVSIAVPEKSLFIDSADSSDAKASVVITKNGEITPEQAQNIVNLVASNIVGLKPENVIVVDENQNTLNTESDEGMGKASQQYDLKMLYKSMLEKNLRSVLNDQQFDSYDIAKVIVNPTLDFDTLTQTTKELANPASMESGAIISRQEEKEELKNGSTGATPGVDSNPGNTPTYPMGGTDAESYKSSKVTENFDYNQTSKESTKALGQVIPERTTAAITLLYGNRVPDDSNLTDAMISEIKALASAAIGGVPVENIAVTKLKIQAPVQVVPTTADTIRTLISEYGLPVLLLLMVIVLVIVGIPRKSKSPQLQPALAGFEEIPHASRFTADIKQEPVPEIDTEERSEVKKQLEKFVKQKPDAVAQLLRNWLTDDYE